MTIENIPECLHTYKLFQDQWNFSIKFDTEGPLHILSGHRSVADIEGFG